MSPAPKRPAEQEDAVKAAAVQLVEDAAGVIQIGAEVLLQGVFLRSLGEGIDADYAVAGLFQLHCEKTFAAADIEDVPVIADKLASVIVAAHPSAGAAPDALNVGK